MKYYTTNDAFHFSLPVQIIIKLPVKAFINALFSIASKALCLVFAEFRLFNNPVYPFSHVFDCVYFHFHSITINLITPQRELFLMEDCIDAIA